MKLIIGLGNPGEKFKNNRHNVGHMAVEALLKKKLPNSVVVKKTEVFMNESGNFVKKLVEQYKVNTSDLWIIHDDLDIALGNYKIQFAKGPKENNGLLSIYEKLKTKDFWHVRVGVDKRNLDNRISGEEYVLKDFSADELVIIDKVINEICKKLATS